MGLRRLQLWMVLILSVSNLAASGPDRRLVDALQKLDVAAARALLKERVQVDTPQADGTTALHWAARWDLVEVADLLLAAGAKANAGNRYGVTPLSLACTNGNLSMVAKLLSAGAEPNRATPDGETPLMTAARTGNAHVIRLLLAHGADVNVKEAWRGQTALMWAAAEKNAEAVQALIEAGGDVRARSRAGLTPLMFAVRAGHLDTVRAVVAGGAEINEPANDALPPPRPRPSASGRDTSETANAPAPPPSLGSTPLAIAITNAHYEVAAWLLDHGADPNLDGPRGPALHALVRSRNCERTAVPCHQQTGALDSFGLARILLARGANVNARLTQNPAKEGGYDYNYMSLVGATPFFLAVKAADTTLMRLLLAHGADPSIGNNQRTTPVLVAAGIGYIEGQILATEVQALEAVKMLVEELGADVNASNDLYETPLHGAAYRGANRIARYLVERGAKLDARDKQGRMPVTIADGVVAGPYFRAHDETAALLRELMGTAAPPRPTTQGAR